MRGLRVLAGASLRRHGAAVSVEGCEHLPRSGAVLIVAHHYHHLLDGALLLARLPRPVHILVALDWVRSRSQRVWMERACRSARWPVILRPAQATVPGVFDSGDVRRYLRRGLRDAVELLREGRVVVIFPEGAPVIDTPARAAALLRGADGLRPFARGFRTLAMLAAQKAAPNLRVLPLGLRYRRTARGWSVRAGLGAPLRPDAPVADVERAVRELSG
jgi:putative membrane protein